MITKHTLFDRVEYRLNGKLHNDKDQPAVIYPNGDQYWWQHGQLHREGDQPAIIFANGHQEWYQDGQCHRGGDQPAVIFANGDQYWYQHGQRHREEGPAVIYVNGEKEYWVKGKRILLQYGIIVVRSIHDNSLFNKDTYHISQRGVDLIERWYGNPWIHGDLNKVYREAGSLQAAYPHVQYFVEEYQ